MENFENRVKFRPDVEEELKKSCSLIEGQETGDQYWTELVHKLTKPPSYTTLRVNLQKSSLADLANQVQACLGEKHGESLRVQPHPALPGVLVIENIGPRLDLPQLCGEVMVDHACGMAVLRGAEIYCRGVLAMTSGISRDDPVSVYSDVDGKCREGSTDKFQGRRVFLGNGRALIGRKELFADITRAGVAISMTSPLYHSPSLSAVLPDLVFAQNLPSIVCGHVLGAITRDHVAGAITGEHVLGAVQKDHVASAVPGDHVADAGKHVAGAGEHVAGAGDHVAGAVPGELVLDMCSAPGGKTNHIASMMRGRGTLIALEKAKNKIPRILESLERWSLADNVHVHCFDSTKALSADQSSAPPWPPRTFDRILLDGPCSALGQRPYYNHKLSLPELRSYPVLQRKLLQAAVPLLKRGGVLVYSTCTFVPAENEEMVAWALQRYPELRLVQQTPYLGLPGRPGLGLSSDQCRLIQRFDPVHASSTLDHDTTAFFIAKFTKI